MISKVLVFVSASLLAQVALVESNCNVKKYSLYQTAGCSVMEKVAVDFVIKDTQPAQTNCDQSATVCVTHGDASTTVDFSGTFAAAITSVNVAGSGKTAQIPVVAVADGQTFATPMVGIFPSAAEVAFANALEFAVEFDATITPVANLILGTANTACSATNLCFLTSARTFKLWGVIGAHKSVTVTGANNAKAVLPLITAVSTDVVPNPVLLQVPTGGVLTASKSISVPFVAETVTGVGGTVTEKKTCAENAACYEFTKFPSTSTFAGVFPSAPLTITIKGQNDADYISYYFGHASTALKAGLLTIASAAAATFMSA